MKSWIICCLFLSGLARANLVYLYPWNDDSYRLLDFQLEGETVQVTVARTPRSENPKVLLDDTNRKLGEIQELASSPDWKREDYQRHFHQRFPMLKIYSVPVANFSKKMAEVLEEKTSFGRWDLLGLALEGMNSEEKLKELRITEQQFEPEGFHEVNWTRDLQNHSLKQARHYHRYITKGFTPEQDLGKMTDEFEERMKNGKGGIAYVLDDEDFTLLVSAYEVAFMKVRYIDRMYRAMEAAYPNLHEDLVSDLKKTFKDTVKMGSAWSNQVQNILLTEARIPTWAIDREMNVLRNLK